VQLSVKDAPDVETVFGGQETQVPAEIAASVDEYLPASHNVQAIEPFNTLKLPGRQAWHGDPLGSNEVYPALQIQALIEVAAAKEMEFCGHITQSPWPCQFLYVPAVQPKHV